MKRRRFIAGAVCPKCGLMDRLTVDGEDGGRVCVACGYQDALETASSQEPKNRLDGALKRTPVGAGTRIVRILDLQAPDSDS